MKFVIGDPPTTQRLETKVEVWQELSSLKVKAVQGYGLVVSCVGMLLVSFALNGAIHPRNGWMTLLILVTILPLHELVHAVTTPGWGLSESTIIGLQKGKSLLLPYMYFDNSQPLWRMLLTGLASVAILTVLPVILIQTAPLSAGACMDLGFLAFFNAAISGGDIVMFFWLITHLPLQATVNGNGWGLLWREKAEERQSK